MNQWTNFAKGLLKENPVLVMLLGMCPTLGVTTSAQNGLGMGLATLFVLAFGNGVIASIKNFIPDKVRIPAFIVVIATFVTLVDLTMSAYMPVLYATLGIFIPLIVVNCIPLSRAEAFASRNGVMASFVDGLGMGLGFTCVLVCLGSVRELLGNGSIFGWHLISADVPTILIFVLPPGAFLVLGYMIALTQRLNKKVG